jgi:hypothetical protein
MNKNHYKYIILLIISIILIVIYLYYTIKNEKFQSEISNDEIIVTLSTSPKRLNDIKETLDSMLNQSIKPNKIFINVPYVFKRTGEEYDNNKLVNIKNIDSRIQINRCEDKGPITKLLETLKLTNNPNSIIIIMDDDINYNNDTIEKLTNELKKNPDKVIAGSIFNHEKINIVEGFKSICFYRKIIKNDFFEFVDKTNPFVHCYKSDDFIISHYLHKNNINAIKSDINIKILNHGLESDALQNQDNITHVQRYSKCNQYINNNYKE